MSTDVRNSIGLWAGSIALFGVLWALWHFKWFDGISDGWFGSIAGLAGFVNLALFFHGLWQRRESNPDNP
ncbi:hypothetical protein NL400_26915, partial [Klebsiella pneumoniae]|nr:hypothetical protein [Klebsiella pneumoniae]